MIAGALQFTLGLEASKFLGGLQGASRGLMGLTAAFESLQGVMSKVWGAMEQGGKLQDLSARTGVAVKDLFQLQAAFEVAGVSSESAGGMLLRLQKSLAGVGEGGEKTGKLFAAMGLNMEQLKGLDPAKQFQALGAAMNKLSKEDAAFASSQIFGRQGAGDFMQIARDMEGFNQAIRESAGAANVFARSAQAFDKVGDTLSLIKTKTQGMFAGIAESLTPAFQQVMDLLNSIDFVAIGQKIGDFFKRFGAAFKEGKISEMLTLSFSAAFEFATNLIVGTLGSPSFWDGIWEVMKGQFMNNWAVIGKTFLSLGTALTAVLDTAFQNVFEALGKTKLGKLMGLEGFTAKSFNENFKDRRDAAAGAQGMFDDWLKTGLGLVGSGGNKIASAVAEAFKNAGGPAQQELKEFWAGLGSKNGFVAQALAGGDPMNLAALLDSGKLGKSSEVTSLEKMGAMMSGLGRGFGQDHARNTADATRQTAINTKMILEKIAPASAGIPDSAFFNFID